VQPVPVAESPQEAVKEKKTKIVPKVPSSMPSMETLISSEAELYLWDGPNDTFINQGIVTASIMLRSGSAYEYWLTATRDTGHLLAHKISDDMNQRFSHKMYTLTWNHLGDDDGSQNSWLFRFNPDDFGVFLQKFTECLWESLHQTQWAKAKVRIFLFSSSL
jgi:VID27 PH-like domain